MTLNSPSHQEIIDVLRPLADIPVGPELFEMESYAELVLYKNAGRCITVGDVLAARDLLSRLDAEGEAPKADRYRWNEPMGRTDISPVPNAVCEASAADIIRFQKQTFPERNYTDDQALNDFVVVHWAWPLNQEGGDAAEREPRSVREPAAESGHVAPPASGDVSGRAIATTIKKYETLLSLLTLRQVTAAGDVAIEAAALNPWAINEGLVTGDETISTWWIDRDLKSLFAAGRLSGIEEEHTRANSLAAEVERLGASLRDEVTARLAAEDRGMKAEAEMRDARREDDDYIDQLNVLCEDFGCVPGSNRLHWLHEQLTELARLKAPLADGEVEEVAGRLRLFASGARHSATTDVDERVGPARVKQWYEAAAIDMEHADALIRRLSLASKAKDRGLRLIIERADAGGRRLETAADACDAIEQIARAALSPAPTPAEETGS